MKEQPLKINKWGNNVYVKIPIVNSKGEFTGKVTGIPSFREGKIKRLESWLSEKNLKMTDFDKFFASWIILGKMTGSFP